MAPVRWRELGTVDIVRVIAGTARGRRIEIPRGLDIRPTSDRAREAVFNRLHSYDLVDGAVVLDLFAGSGALGIEALSRGAESVTFVDQSPAAIAAIRSNLEAIGFDGAAATVVRSSAHAFLAGSRSSFDVAFLDPPYDYDDWASILDTISADTVVVESNRAIDAGPRWTELKTSRYGAATIAVLELPDRYLQPHGGESDADESDPVEGAP